MSSQAVTPSLKYVHKEHKFRVQSFMIKTLKKELSISKKDLIDRILGKFTLS